jgi:D,D-heptose 1,7-bisphosphate phosphatase
MPENKALFLDRDGTIVKEVEGDNPAKPEELGYLTKPEQVQLIAGAAAAIASARKLGYKIIVITNQSAIARGWLSTNQLEVINSTMYSLLGSESSDAIIDDLFYSPYHKDGVVEEYAIEHPSRKPGTAMIDEAARKYDIDLTKSYIVGDAFSDMKTGENAGIKRILVMTGYGKIAYKKCLDEKVKIDFIAEDLSEAVEYIGKNA